MVKTPTQSSFSKLLRSIEIRKCRVRRTTGKIFFCGGEVDLDTADWANLRSAREGLCLWLRENDKEKFDRVVLAEDVLKDEDETGFNDVLTLEHNISQLANLIPIVVESPGSFTELGAFATDDVVSKRLHVIMDRRYGEDKSFIQIGPVAKIRAQDPNRVRLHQLFVKDVDENGKLAVDVDRLAADAEEIAKIIFDNAHALNHEEVFRPDNRGHVGLMIVEVLQLCGALTIMQIAEVIKMASGDSSAGSALAKQHVYLLEKLKLVRRVKKGGTQYYITIDPEPFIKIAGKENPPLKIDRDGIRIAESDWAQQHEPARFKAMQEAIKGVDDE